MLAFLLQKAESVTTYDFCFWETSDDRCKNLPGGAQATTSAQFSTYTWTTPLTQEKLVYIADSVTITETAYTNLVKLLVPDSNFDPTLVLASGITVTLTLGTITIAGTLNLPKHYAIDKTTSLTVQGLVTIDPSVVTDSTIIAQAGLTLTFPAVAKSFEALFTGPNPLFQVTGDVTYTFPSQPEKVTLDTPLYSYELPGSVTISTDIPPQKTVVSNVFDTLNLEINADPAKSLTFNVKDATTSSITVTGSVSTLTTPITISSTPTVNSFPVMLPLLLAQLNNQQIFAPNNKLIFKSTKDICVYHQGQVTTSCEARQTLVDTDIQNNFLDTQNSVMFIHAQLDVAAFKNLDLSNTAKWIFSGQLILSVKAVLTLETVSFPADVIFGKIDNTLTLTSSFKAPIAAISGATGTGKISVSEPTITLAVNDAVAEALKVFSDDAIVTLKYSDAENLALTTTAGPPSATTINDKKISLSHSIVISSDATIQSFVLMWPNSDPPTKKITLNAVTATKLWLERGFASTASLVVVHLDKIPTEKIHVNCFSAISSTPFTSDQSGTFEYNIITAICVYTGSASSDCAIGGIKDTDLTVDLASKASSIEFHGDCTVDISVLTPHLDFTDTFYHIGSGLSLNVKDPATVFGPIVLSDKTILKDAIKAQSLVAPLASIDNKIAAGAIDIPAVTLQLPGESKTISTNLAQIKTDAIITLSFKAPPTTLAFGDGSKVVQVQYGQATFEYSGKQKYIFGASPATEMQIMANAITKALPDPGTYSLPITATTKITFDKALITQAGYLTLTGIKDANTAIIVVVPAAVVDPLKGPLTGENIVFKYAVKDTSYCFVGADGPNPECFAITQKVGAVGFTGALLEGASYIRVVGEITCELDLFSTGMQTNSVIFAKPEIFDFVGHGSMIGLLNAHNMELVTLTLIDKIHIAGTLTTATINTPIESLPTDNVKITTDTANIVISSGKSSDDPTVTPALSTLVAKSKTLTVNLKAKDTDKLVLVYDADQKTGGPIFCNNKLTKFTGPINYQPQKSTSSFTFDIVGAVQTSGNLNLGSVAITDQTRLVLGDGFNQLQQTNLLELTFTPKPIANYPVSVQPNFADGNAPFKPFDQTLQYEYKRIISKICIFGKTAEQVCVDKEKEGYKKIAVGDLVDQIYGAKKVYVAEAIEVEIEKFTQDGNLIIKSDVFTLADRLTLKITKSTPLETVEIEMGMNVVIVEKIPTAQLLDIVTQFTTLSCEAKVVDTLKGAQVVTWNIFVDPSDMKVYLIIDNDHIVVSGNCNFQVKGTEAKIVFKPSDDAGKSSITVCDSTYTWPTAPISFASSLPDTQFAQVDVDFVPTETIKELEGKYDISLSNEGTLKILDGLKQQPSSKSPFDVQSEKYKVLYPESMDPNNHFIPPSSSVIVDTWLPPQPPKPSKKGSSFPGWAIAVIVIVVVIVISVVVVLVLNFTGVIHLCGKREDAPPV